MDFDFSAESFYKLFMAFRKSVWFRVAYLLLLSVIILGLFATAIIAPAASCFLILAIPILVFIVPYFLGERRTGHFLLNALLVFVVATLLIAVVQTDTIVNAGPVELSNLGSGTYLTLWNGTVTPYKAAPPQNFTFRVRLVTSPGVNLSNVSVWVFLFQLDPFSQSNDSVPMALLSSAGNSTWFVAYTTLGAAVLQYLFYANDGRGNFTYTTTAYQPITASWPEFYGFWVVLVGQYTAFLAVFYLLIVFLFWYTVRSRKIRERLITAETLDKTEKAKESDAGGGAAAGAKATKAAAFTCTNCGADVDEGDEKCPKCGAVFED